MFIYDPLENNLLSRNLQIIQSKHRIVKQRAHGKVSFTDISNKHIFSKLWNKVVCGKKYCDLFEK